MSSLFSSIQEQTIKYTYVGYYYKQLNITIERHFSSHVYNYVLL